MATMIFTSEVFMITQENTLKFRDIMQDETNKVQIIKVEEHKKEKKEIVIRDFIKQHGKIKAKNVLSNFYV